MNNPTGKSGSWVAGTKIWNFGFFSGYNLCIFIGIILAFITVAYHWRRQKYSWENLQILIILIVPFSIFGARFYTVMFDGGWSDFFTFAGMSIYGGVIGAVIPASIYLYFRRDTLDYRIVLTIILPTVLIGQAIGRWGNFQNHEVYGLVVSGPSLDWMGDLKSHMYITATKNGIPAYRAPIFFYESMLNLGAYILLVWVLNDRNWLKPGVTGALYMVAYGIIRLVLQVFRDPSPMNTSYIGNSGIALNLVVSGLAISFGVLIALYWQFRFKMFTIKHDAKEFKLFKKWTIKIKARNFDVNWGSRKKYELITPKKEVRRFFVGVRLPKFKKQEGSKMLKFDGWTPAKFERTFRIWLPDKEENSKWSKRELNKGKRNKKRK